MAKYKTTIDIKRDGEWMPPGSVLEFSEQEVIDRLQDKSIRPISQEQVDADSKRESDTPHPNADVLPGDPTGPGPSAKLNKP
jgi:hypothetical protein